jgi:ATP-binding cassette, subfamily B, bacterial
MPLERSTLAQALEGVRAWIVRSPRWLLIGRLPATSVPLTVAVALSLLLSAALPTAFMLVSGVLVGVIPEAVEQGPGSPARERATLTLIGLGLIFVVQQIVMSLSLTASECLGRRVMGDHARQVMRATMRPAGLAHLERPESLDQISRALSIHWVSPHAAVTAMVQDAGRRIQGGAALLVVAYFAWWVALLLLIALVHSTWRFGPIRRQLVNVRMGKAQGFRRASYFLDLTLRPEAAKEVRVFGLADWLVSRYERAWLGAMAELWTRRSSLWTTVLLAGLPVAAAELLGLGVAGWSAVNGTLGLGELMVFASAVRWSTLIGALGDADSRIEHGAAGLLPTLELERALATDPSINPPGAASADGLPAREIRFEGVGFGYPDRPGLVFSNLDLTVPAGRSLAIVGDNGAGKTTLVKLLARLYEPTVGRITVDGTDLREYSAQSWQRRVAAIFQDFVQYQLSASDNVAVGAIERTRDRATLIEAGTRAGAHDVVERLPHGWDTILSRRFTGGTELSGGEWQRFGLARALFAAASGAGILVLDEPTAQLDVRAEAAFYDQFFDLTQGVTTIVISHRFSTVRRADRIVVLDGGKVVEAGSHDELLAANGRYATMFRLQATRFVEDAESTLSQRSHSEGEGRDGVRDDGHAASVRDG